MDPVIRAADGDESFAQIMQGGLRCATDLSDMPLGHHEPRRSPIRQAREGMSARPIAAETPLRLFVDLDLRDQAARRRLPTGEIDAG